jgi:hypothetical protein
LLCDCVIDVDRDGFLSLKDLINYCEDNNIEFKKQQLKEMLWLLDDNSRGYLIFDDIKNFYLRYRPMFLASGKPYMKSSLNIILGKSLSIDKDSSEDPILLDDLLISTMPSPINNNNSSNRKKSDYIRHSKNHRGSKMYEDWNVHLQPLMFIRILLFSSMQDRFGDIHLLTAYQVRYTIYIYIS